MNVFESQRICWNLAYSVKNAILISSIMLEIALKESCNLSNTMEKGA